MDGMHTTFRRLSDVQLKRFRPLYFIVRHPAWRVTFFLILLSVCVKWVVTR